jgi:biotin transport system substrate-specific component
LTTFASTLSDRYFPRTANWLRDFAIIVGGSLLVAALAQIRIILPFTPVPITGQTFGVLLIGAGLGSKRGMAAMGLYLAEGAVGLPFFSGGTHGISILTGATGGYLIGFVIASLVIGFLAERGLERSLRTSLLPFVIGSVIIYLCGAGWLAFLTNDIQKAIFSGILPFLVGDVIKIILAGVTFPVAWKMLNNNN